MPKFRKKPVVVEAMQFTGGPANLAAILYWIGQSQDAPGPRHAFVNEDGRFIIRTLEGDMQPSDGDWIIEGVNGEFYPCKPDIFAKTYEPAE